MGFLTRLKCWGIQVADFYTDLKSPYDDFVRPFVPKSSRTLSDREAECWADLPLFFRNDNEVIVNHLRWPEPQPLDTGDQAIWHGIYTAMLAMKYSVIPTEQTGKLIDGALRGLHNHQRFHGEGRPRLIRGYDRSDNNRWQDDASNDSLTGHLAGIYFAAKHGPPAFKDQYMELAAGMVEMLIDHDLQLVNADNSPTKHGKLINGVLTDPLQMSLVLAILTIGERWNLHPKAGQKRHEIWSKYGAMLPYGKVAFGPKENWNDEHRAAIHLAILAREDDSEGMQDRVQYGLRRLWKICEPRANIWVNALISYGMDKKLIYDMKEEMRRQAVGVLGEFELTDQQYDTESINQNVEFIGYGGTSWKPRTFDVSGTLRANQPLPHYAAGRQDFVYQRHRYSVNDRIGQTTPSSRFNGGAFLCAYWLSRLTGILKETD